MTPPNPPYISCLVVVVGRQQVAFQNSLIELYRMVVVWRRSTNDLPINSTKPTPTIRRWRPKSTFQIQNDKVTIRQPFESSPAAHSNVKPVYNHSSFSLRSNSQKTLFLNAAPSMIIVTCEIHQKRPRQSSTTWRVDCSAVDTITTARPPCGRPRKHTSRDAASSMTGWLHSDP